MRQVGGFRATTIHKAQGMTLDCAAVDVANAFATGQAYVALSRCRSPDSLQILGQGGREGRRGLRRAIRCCPVVAEFDAKLRAACVPHTRGMAVAARHHCARV